jgi:hypothetical protein
MGTDIHVVLSHKLCGFWGHVGGRIVMMKEQWGACSNFLLRSPGKVHNWSRGRIVLMKEQWGACSNILLRSPGKVHNWSQRGLWTHGLFCDSLHWWVLEFFQHFLSFCWCLVNLNICHFQLTFDWPWNMNAIKKQLSSLKNVLQKPHKASERFW